MDVKSRYHLRSDAVRDLRATLNDQLGVTIPGDRFELVELETGPFDVVAVDGEPNVLYYTADGDRRPFLTVRGANTVTPTQRTVTVDAGAISFVSNGADIMRPGIETADEAIDAGDLVVVQEETHGKALAIGESRVDGTALLGDDGKVIDSVHHVGDDLYAFTP